MRILFGQACGKGTNQIHKMLCNAGEVFGNSSLCTGFKHLNESAKLEMCVYGELMASGKAAWKWFF